jgi:hypothetical protein
VVEEGDQVTVVAQLEVVFWNKSSNLSLGKKRGIHTPSEIEPVGEMIDRIKRNIRH